MVHYYLVGAQLAQRLLIVTPNVCCGTGALQRGPLLPGWCPAGSAPVHGERDLGRSVCASRPRYRLQRPVHGESGTPQRWQHVGAAAMATRRGCRRSDGATEGRRILEMSVFTEYGALSRDSCVLKDCRNWVSIGCVYFCFTVTLRVTYADES